MTPAKGLRPDVVVTDVPMGGMDGFAVSSGCVDLVLPPAWISGRRFESV